MTTELWQFVRKVTWSSMSHHSFCPKISLSMGAKHLGGAFFREERLQDEHLHQGVRYHGWAQGKLACPKPTHIIAKVTKTLQIIVRSFRSSALCRPWKKEVLKTGLNVKPSPPGFPSACGGFDSRSQRSCFRALLVPMFPSEEEGVKIQWKSYRHNKRTNGRSVKLQSKSLRAYF